MPVYQDLSRFRLPAGFRGRNALVVQVWWLIQGSLFRYSPQFMYGFRRFLLRLFGAQIGRGVLIRPTAVLTYPWKVSIGENSWIGDNVVIYSLAPVEIGVNTVISQRSYICAGTHDYKSIEFAILGSRVQVADEAWICSDVFVGPGARVELGAVVGARSSVFDVAPEGMISVGCPARPIRSRNDVGN